MKSIEDILEDCPLSWAEIWNGNTETCIDVETVREIIKEYAIQIIDEYERKLYEYDGSVTYSQISNELKSEL